MRSTRPSSQGFGLTLMRAGSSRHSPRKTSPWRVACSWRPSCISAKQAPCLASGGLLSAAGPAAWLCEQPAMCRGDVIQVQGAACEVLLAMWDAGTACPTDRLLCCPCQSAGAPAVQGTPSSEPCCVQGSSWGHTAAWRRRRLGLGATHTGAVTSACSCRVEGRPSPDVLHGRSPTELSGAGAECSVEAATGGVGHRGVP